MNGSNYFISHTRRHTKRKIYKDCFILTATGEPRKRPRSTVPNDLVRTMEPLSILPVYVWSYLSSMLNFEDSDNVALHGAAGPMCEPYGTRFPSARFSCSRAVTAAPCRPTGRGATFVEHPVLHRGGFPPDPPGAGNYSADPQAILNAGVLRIGRPPRISGPDRFPMDGRQSWTIERSIELFSCRGLGLRRVHLYVAPSSFVHDRHTDLFATFFEPSDKRSEVDAALCTSRRRSAARRYKNQKHGMAAPGPGLPGLVSAMPSMIKF